MALRTAKTTGGILWFYLRFLTLFTVSKSTYTNLQLHKRMDPLLLKQTFHVESYDKVPHYEVVHVRTLSKRSADDDEVKRVHLSAFGRDMHLHLQRNDDFDDRLKSMKMYLAESTNNGIQYREMSTEDDDPGTTYHDLDQMAAVTIRHGADGKIQMEGTIGNDLVVKPVPTAILIPEDGFVDDEMFLDEDESYERNRNNSFYTHRNNASSSVRQPSVSTARGGAHFVYRGQMMSNDSHSDFLPLDNVRGHFNSRADTGPMYSHRSKRALASSSVWPEILLLVDYGSFVLHGLSSRHIKRYFVSFWNGVDLRYKALSNPKIRISLAGIIVAKSKDATPYLERNRLPSPNRDAIDAAAALTDMGKYLYLEDRLPAYDMAVVMTKLDMCRKQFAGGRCSRGTAGFAYVGGACVVNKRLEKVNSVAIIEDSGGFSGIIVAAHEVGHLLGCVHDGSPPPSYLGGPGASRCPWEDGFIMSDLRHTDRGFRWSKCSIEQFKHFLNGETASCLFNYPDDNKLLERELPGTMLTLDEQCERDRGTQACFKDSRVCAQLFCYDNDSGYCVSFRPAAEGSSCGDGQICKNGKCVVDNENIIPDYTHVTRSIVNRVDKEVSKQTTSRPPSPNVSKPQARNNRRPHRPSYTGRNNAVPAQKDPTSTTTAKSVATGKVCEDAVDKLAGGLTCQEFLQRYGDRYCRHSYMTKNCCYSHQIVCANT
ncbi:A disintegrin and metalloproteinase with thrombospondin motifs like [Argiope bruennichi]|uniref:A disintegrin and metalloproteinase with thrombospondin motifs like n=1 Tax=Argiope bruennichi TaxID=94029 RepID=UPI0024942F7F|nr:A disintegrin and metalloproteinase with thrombospondin motifs like [Argiope bruennichi]XP_055953662.1 A disintegrin and metalloproteinase with thrombospondin motifs like [Argiope bruennichi]XP_055953663.1 A disintegrin and metalloproteinase with thrombospondin motifs like [Argiope bruennichi]